jgi:hypothetical protein
MLNRNKSIDSAVKIDATLTHAWYLKKDRNGCIYYKMTETNQEIMRYLDYDRTIF